MTTIVKITIGGIVVLLLAAFGVVSELWFGLSHIPGEHPKTGRGAYQ